MDTHFQKKERGKIRWHVVDAEGVVLGRLAARTARILIGKDYPDWTPFSDHREGIIVVNAEKVRLTGKKLQQKFYRHYTGYPGGLRETSAQRMLETKPEELVREAVPFSLKLIESLLAESPRHRGLLLAACKGFTPPY